MRSTGFLNKLILIYLVCMLCSAHLYAARPEVDSMLRLVEKSNDSVAAVLLYNIGTQYENISSDSTELFAHKAVAMAKKAGLLQIEAQGYALLGIVHKNKGEFESAIQWHLKALKIKEQLKDDRDLAVSHNDLGVVYKSMKRWDEALVEYKKSNELCRKVGYGLGVSMTYNNIGTVFAGHMMVDSAFAYYQKAYDEAIAIKSDFAKVTALANLAEIYAERKQYTKAADALLQCLEFDKAKGDKYGMSLSYLQLARVYDKMGNYEKAARYADTSETIARGEAMDNVLVEVYSERSKIEENAGNYAKALVYLKEFRVLNDSMLNKATNNKISELMTQYETVKKEQQIEKQQTDIRSKNYVISGLALLIGLAALLGYSFYHRYKLTQAAKLQSALLAQQEAATLAVLEAEERERKRIATDLHDGVGQMMSAARMNLSVLGNELDNPEEIATFNKAMHLVDESCKEVRQVSHNIMPNTLMKRGLVYAVNEFINSIDKRALDINVYTDNMDVRLPVNVEIMLYRAIQECVNNVIKHAQAKRVNISIIKDEEELSITIEDNGKGFDVKAGAGDKGIGLKNIETRIQYLKGTVSWESSPGNGTVVMIYVPAASYALLSKQELVMN